MTEADKKLLFEDLCGRLLYGVKGIITYDKSNTTFTVEGIDNNVLHLSDAEECYVEDFKPYLRPMSSMTDEEKGELKLEQEKDEELFIQVINKSQNGDDSLLGTVIPHCAEDWANKNHFDYRGLIPMGLALEAQEGMYNIKEK
jgi:hypothetical protein